MVDEEGYRANVGIVIANDAGKLLWAKRKGQRDAWQFPQGGIDEGETPEETMYRELDEELGLEKHQVELVDVTPDWLSYRLPRHMQRHKKMPLVIGQKQKWFLLRMLEEDSAVILDKHRKPEFDDWQWVDYWYPVNHVIEFKRRVYKQALDYFVEIVQPKKAKNK